MQPKGLAACALTLTLVLSACQASEPRSGGSATGFLLEPTTLDPSRCADTTCTEVVQRLYDSLVGYDHETAELIPAAAESWESNEDGTLFTFQLREGATFHNGDPVTAADFVRGLTTAALQETASEVAGQLAGIVGFDAAQAGESEELPGVRQGTSEREVVIELDAPNPEFLIRTGHTVFSPLPAVATEDPDGFREEPVGNGPYQMDGPWQHNQQIAVAQFPDYTGDKPGFLDGITWRIFADVESAYIEFQDANLDVTQVPPEQFVEAAGDLGDAFVDVATAGNQFLAARTDASPTDSVLMRQAISLAINREAIVQSVFNDQRIAATSIIPPATPGYRPDICSFCEYDPDEAQRLLGEAGGPPDEPIMFTWVGAGTHDNWVLAVRDQLEQNLGLRTDQRIHADGRGIVGFITGTDPVTGDPVEQMDGGFIVIGWGQDFPTPDSWLFSTLHSSQDGVFSGYSNTQYDQLLDEAQRSGDADERLGLQQQAEDLALDEMPILPMWYDKAGLAYNDERIATFAVDLQLGLPAWEEIALA